MEIAQKLKNYATKFNGISMGDLCHKNFKIRLFMIDEMLLSFADKYFVQIDALNPLHNSCAFSSILKWKKIQPCLENGFKMYILPVCLLTQRKTTDIKEHDV